MDARDAQVAGEVEVLATPLLESEGISLVDVEYRREPSGRILRLILDKTGGVSLEDCASISSELGDLLDVKSNIRGPYNMEISSPGIDFRLSKRRHFRHFIGRQIVIWVRAPVAGKDFFEGLLEGISEKGIVSLLVGKETVDISYDNIGKARLKD